MDGFTACPETALLPEAVQEASEPTKPRRQMHRPNTQAPLLATIRPPQVTLQRPQGSGKV
jgi:hypothetical protein